MIDELARALSLANSAAGPLVLVMVLSAGAPFTAEEASCLERLGRYLGPAALSHSLVLFTHGDELEADDTLLYEYLRDAPPYLKVGRGHALHPYPYPCLIGSFITISDRQEGLHTHCARPMPSSVLTSEFSLLYSEAH